jgi:hypothetical protein
MRLTTRTWFEIFVDLVPNSHNRIDLEAMIILHAIHIKLIRIACKLYNSHYVKSNQ